jgi:hypothetical protein
MLVTGPKGEQLAVIISHIFSIFILCSIIMFYLPFMREIKSSAMAYIGNKKILFNLGISYSNHDIDSIRSFIIEISIL